jgi:hypothetical protein
MLTASALLVAHCPQLMVFLNTWDPSSSSVKRLTTSKDVVVAMSSLVHALHVSDSSAGLHEPLHALMNAMKKSSAKKEWSTFTRIMLTMHPALVWPPPPPPHPLRSNIPTKGRSLIHDLMYTANEQDTPELVLDASRTNSVKLFLTTLSSTVLERMTLVLAIYRPGILMEESRFVDYPFEFMHDDSKFLLTGILTKEEKNIWSALVPGHTSGEWRKFACTDEGHVEPEVTSLSLNNLIRKDAQLLVYTRVFLV